VPSATVGYGEAAAMPTMSAAAQPWKHRAVLDLRGHPGRPGQVVELRVTGAALHVRDLPPADHEGHPELGQR